MAKKKKGRSKKELTAEELAEIEELTDNLGPEIKVPEELQKELAGAEEEGSELTVENDTLTSELEDALEEARNNQELYLRALAEMDNLRKRNQREKDDISKFGNENILREILPVIDNLERAVEHATSQEDSTGLVEGVQMTLGQFSSVLQKFGVETLSSIGEIFDPAHHQAMGQIETTEVPVNHVAQEMQKGYLLNNRLLRPALVMVAKPPQPITENDENPEPAEDSGENQG